MLREYENEFLRVELLPNAIVRVTRTARAFASLAELTRVWKELLTALSRVDRATHCLIVDTRAPPGRNDPAFEQAFGPLRREMTRDFPRVAILVRSAVSQLQVRRHAVVDGQQMRPFTEETQALAWLRGEDEA